MNIRLKNILDENTTKINNWVETINTHNKYNYLAQDSNQEQFTDMILKTANVLGEISELFFKYGGFKDTFDNRKFYPHVYGISLIIKSIKTGTTFNFGIDNNGIYLNSSLRYSENLKNMDDKFWLELLSLPDFGQFELIENELFGNDIKSKYPDLFLSYKGTAFRLFRKYFIGTIEEKKFIDLGELQVSWTTENDFSDVISNGCLAFKTLYKLNYALWKIDDLKVKKK